MTTASRGSAPAARAASSRSSGSGLPMTSGETPAAASIAAMTLPAPGRSQRPGGIDRIAVRGDEPGPGPDAVGGGGDAKVGELRIQARHDRVGMARGGPAVEALLRHPLRDVGRADHVQPDVPQLPIQPRRADGQDPADARLALGEVERRRPWRADDPVGRHRRAHRGQPGHVVGPVVHRVVGDVDDVVAGGGPLGEERGDAGDGIGAAIDDAVEIDEEEHARRC